MPRDLAALAEALRNYLPGGQRITGIRQMTWGLSNGTYLLEGLERVLRMPPEEEGLLPPYDMARQHDVYRRVASAPGGPPVPRVYELCEDESVAGDPFYVMEMLRGESFDRHNLPSWLVLDADACGRFCEAWVDALATTHLMPADTLTGPPRWPEREAAEWLETAMAHQAPELVLRLLEHFATHPPSSSGAAATVHGDPNLTNLLWDGPRVIALLDWELSGVGEPLADIGFMLAFLREQDEPADWGPSLPGWWSKERFVEHWEQRTARSAADWRSHELLAMARLATIMCIGRGLVRDGRKTDPRVVAMTEKLVRYMDRIERRAAKAGLRL